MPFLPPDLFPFMLLIPKVLLHYFLSEQILENYCSLLKQAAAEPGAPKKTTIIEDRQKQASAAEYAIEIIAWTL